YEQGLEPLLNFFVAARNLRQKEDVISYAHPRVEEALENIVVAEPIRSERAVSRVVDAVLSSPSAFGNEAGSLAAAAGLLDAVARLEALAPSISATSLQRLDRWLEQQLLEGDDRKFDEFVQLAARIGSQASDVAE
ncbi:hypothetical protein, partial [Xanthomonas euvesicatoria]|uniref:hypothetical protein n=1 Tax=Xanthomonas euvesicatoria TaxID=456327 RepID=UPI0013DFED95